MRTYRCIATLCVLVVLLDSPLVAQVSQDGFGFHTNGVTVLCDSASVGASGTINGIMDP